MNSNQSYHLARLWHDTIFSQNTVAQNHLSNHFETLCYFLQEFIFSSVEIRLTNSR